MWKAGLATFDNIKNDGSESARSTYSLSRSKREKLSAILEKQNTKPRVQTKMSRYRNPPLQENFRGSRSSSRNNNSRRSRHNKNHSRNNNNKRGSASRSSRLRQETNLTIPENKPIVEERNSRTGMQIIIPEPIFFNGLNSIERPQWSLTETEDKTTFGISFWIRPSPTLGAKTTNRAEKYSKRRMLGNNRGSSPGFSSPFNEKGIDLSGSEWRVVCCRRGAREIDSILRMQQYGDYGEELRHGNNRKKIGIDPGELCTPMLQLSAKTCQLQLYVWTTGSSMKPAGRLMTNNACPYGIWTHVTIALNKNIAKIYLNGRLDVEASFNDNIYLPEASLLLGRGNLEKKNKLRNSDNNSSYAPSVASSRMSTADFVNGGGDSTSRTTSSRHNLDEPDDDPEGFVGFLSDVTLHARRISSGHVEAMVKDGETPLEPVEQDEWSLLVNVSKRMQDDQERKKRERLRKVKAEQKKVLDEQVAYLKKKRADDIKAEREADLLHLSRYNANGDQLQHQIAREKAIKVQAARKEMAEQRRLERIKREHQEQEEMIRDKEDMDILQRQIKETAISQEKERQHKRDTSKRMMASYAVLMEEKKAKEEKNRLMEEHDRQLAEMDARQTIQLETARKKKKHYDQIQYRKQLADQVKMKKAQNASKYHLSEQERTINRRYLQEIIEEQRDGNIPGDSNWEGSQYSFGPQTGRSQKHKYSSSRRDYNYESPQRGSSTMSKQKLEALKRMLNE
jgi:hypothetical protein